MPYGIFLCLLMTAVFPAQTNPREVVYGGAVTLGHQAVPLFANGYLIYIHQPNRLQVFRPDTQLAYDYEVPCVPEATRCSVGAVAVARNGAVALGMGYATGRGSSGGIRLLDERG